MQGLFRNPLADPSLIGISSGAALAATFVVIVGDVVSFSLPPFVQLFAFPVAAFVGAIITTIIIYKLSTIAGQTAVATLLLAGIAINALAQAFSGFLTFYATDTQIRSLTFWKLGSLGGANWLSILVILPFILFPIILFFKIARPLNALLLGESEAGHLGFDIEKIKKFTIVLVALSVGASVAFTGLITFVGLVVPHLLRLLIGPDHRYLLPGSALLGACLLLAQILRRGLWFLRRRCRSVFNGNRRRTFFSVAAVARQKMEDCSLIEARNITVEINGKKLLDSVSAEVKCGEVLAVLGPNGAGKSTLRKILCGDLIPSQGEVFMDGKNLKNWSLPQRAKVRAVLPQDSNLDFPFSVLEVVLMGRAPHIKSAESARDYEIARSALKIVDEENLEDRIYTTLSGGERQRVQLARVLAQVWEQTEAARYLILDEPTSNLDLTHQHQTLKLARKFSRQNVGVLVILHDLNLAAQYADKILILKDGKNVRTGIPNEVLSETLIQEVFGVKVSVIKHPFFDCPLVVWKEDSNFEF